MIVQFEIEQTFEIDLECVSLWCTISDSLVSGTSMLRKHGEEKLLELLKEELLVFDMDTVHDNANYRSEVDIDNLTLLGEKS